jgi:pyruvate,orthophosphate dikinase
LRELLGGKGAGLHEMTRIGAPVPPGFTITTDVCSYYYAHHRQDPRGLASDVMAGLARVEKILGRRFGDSDNPLLVSVRSGARESMPGMMDTVLNLGLNDRTVQGLIRRTKNPRFAYDSYRRFVQMYADVVLGLKPKERTKRDPFEEIMEQRKKTRRVRFDTELEAKDLEAVVAAFKDLVKSRTGKNSLVIPRNNFGVPSGLFLVHGTTIAPLLTATFTTSHTWGRLSTFRLWSSEILAKSAPPVWLSRGILRLEKGYSTVSFSSTLRERMSLLASGHQTHHGAEYGYVPAVRRTSK